MLTCISPSTQRNLVCCAKKAGLLLFQFPEHLELWRLGESVGHGEESAHRPSWSHVPTAELLHLCLNRKTRRQAAAEEETGEADRAEEEGVCICRFELTEPPSLVLFGVTAD